MRVSRHVSCHYDLPRIQTRAGGFFRRLDSSLASTTSLATPACLCRWSLSSLWASLLPRARYPQTNALLKWTSCNCKFSFSPLLIHQSWRLLLAFLLIPCSTEHFRRHLPSHQRLWRTQGSPHRQCIDVGTFIDNDSHRHRRPPRGTHQLDDQHVQMWAGGGVFGQQCHSHPNASIFFSGGFNTPAMSSISIANMWCRDWKECLTRGSGNHWDEYRWWRENVRVLPFLLYVLGI